MLDERKLPKLLSKNEMLNILFEEEYGFLPKKPTSLSWKVEKNIVELTDIELICADCHACKHRNQFAVYRVMEGASGLVYGIPRADFLTIHLMRVNNVTKEVIYAYRKELLKELDEFEKQRIRNYNFESKDEEIEYKYVIDENIPLKEEIEAVLREKQLLLQKEK